MIEEKCVLFEEINKLSLGGSDGKKSFCNAVDPGSIHESRRSPGERNVYPLQYTCLDNFMDRGDRQTTVGYSPWGCKKSNNVHPESDGWAGCVSYATLTSKPHLLKPNLQR